MADKKLVRLKKWGQHFLEDEQYLALIVACGEVSPADHVLEIGPGDGRLSRLLLAAGAALTAIEIDPRWAAWLRAEFASQDKFNLLEQDFLKLGQDAEDQLFRVGAGLKVIANLPYYITTPILIKLPEHRAALELMVIMVQKEVGERLAAEVGSRAAGAITLYLQYYTTIEIIDTVPAKAFRPQPKIDSVILKIKPRVIPPVAVSNEELFWRLIRAAFAQRRKTLVNALLALKDQKITRSSLESGLKMIGLNAKIRGEKMRFEEFAALCDYLDQ